MLVSKMPTHRQLVTSDEARPRKTQHTQPCADCPWGRASLPGWLGGADVQTWLQVAHSDTHVPCHTVGNQQCAGIAIYRRNVAKRVDPPLLRLEKDVEKVFATPMEFQKHHGPNTNRASEDKRHEDV